MATTRTANNYTIGILIDVQEHNNARAAYAQEFKEFVLHNGSSRLFVEGGDDRPMGQKALSVADYHIVVRNSNNNDDDKVLETIERKTPQDLMRSIIDTKKKKNDLSRNDKQCWKLYHNGVYGKAFLIEGNEDTPGCFTHKNSGGGDIERMAIKTFRNSLIKGTYYFNRDAHHQLEVIQTRNKKETFQYLLDTMQRYQNLPAHALSELVQSAPTSATVRQNVSSAFKGKTQEYLDLLKQPGIGAKKAMRQMVGFPLCPSLRDFYETPHNANKCYNIEDPAHAPTFYVPSRQQRNAILSNETASRSVATSSSSHQYQSTTERRHDTTSLHRNRNWYNREQDEVEGQLSARTYITEENNSNSDNLQEAIRRSLESHKREPSSRMVARSSSSRSGGGCGCGRISESKGSKRNAKRKYRDEPIGTIELLSDDDNDNDDDNDRKPAAKINRMELIEILDSEDDDDDDDEHISRNTIIVIDE